MVMVTVIPSDKLIIVDGEPIQFDFPHPDNLHALQWYGKTGHLEWIDDYNMMLDESLYDEEVEPYVNLWKNEKERLERERERIEEERLINYNSESSRYSRLRVERDRRMNITDYLAMPDYPISDEKRKIVNEYRQKLRDLPSQDGAPWDGGGDETPWPVLQMDLKKSN